MSDFNKCIHENVCRYIFPCLHCVEHISCEYYEDPKQGEWIDTGYGTSRCSVCGEKCQTYCMDKPRDRYCLWCGASMSANDRQVTGKLNSETEYKAKVKELENAIAKCEKAEEEFKKRTCKFKSPTNCDFCSFHSDCDEHWKEGDEK